MRLYLSPSAAPLGIHRRIIIFNGEEWECVQKSFHSQKLQGVQACRRRTYVQTNFSTDDEQKKHQENMNGAVYALLFTLS